MVIINDMKKACKFTGVADSNNSFEAFDKSFKQIGHLPEVFAIETQVYSIKGDKRGARDVYKLSDRFGDNMDNPKVKGLLKESGGKMYMSERQWKDA